MSGFTDKERRTDTATRALLSIPADDLFSKLPAQVR